MKVASQTYGWNGRAVVDQKAAVFPHARDLILTYHGMLPNVSSIGLRTPPPHGLRCPSMDYFQNRSGAPSLVRFHIEMHTCISMCCSCRRSVGDYCQVQHRETRLAGSLRCKRRPESASATPAYDEGG